MTMFISKSQKDREMATIFRMGKMVKFITGKLYLYSKINKNVIFQGFEMAGILVGLGIFTPFATDSADCRNKTTSNETILFENKTGLNQTSTFWEENKCFIPAVVLTVIFIISAVLLLIYVKENRGIYFYCYFCYRSSIR